MTQYVRMLDMPVSERPRERFLAEGGDRMKTEELVAILLRSGTRGVSALDAARQLVSRYRSLDQLAQASLDDIQSVRGIGLDKAITLKSAFVLAQRMASELQAEAPLLDTPERVAYLLREENRLYTVERFQVLLLNTRRRLIRLEKLAHGTLDTLLVHPREVFRAAIAANAAAIVIVHNHPSGDPTPSDADVKVTRDLIRAGRLLKIELLDHIILGRRTEERPQDFLSLRELGHFHE